MKGMFCFDCTADEITIIPRHRELRLQYQREYHLSHRLGHRKLSKKGREMEILKRRRELDENRRCVVRVFSLYCANDCARKKKAEPTTAA